MKNKLLAFIIILFTLSTAVIVQAADTVIQNRIDALYNLVGNMYFNTEQSIACGKKSAGHSCGSCYTPNIVESEWFKKLFGTCTTSQFANQYGNGVTYTRNGWSCLGFANFAEWYIFKTANTDTVSTNNMGTYSFNYSNAQIYAKKGDILRLGNRHSVIFISANENGIYVLDSNYQGTYNCLVTKHNIPYTSYTEFTISRAINRANLAPVTTTVPYTFSSLTKNAEEYTVKTELYNFSQPCEVIAVGYENGRMAAFQIKTYNQNTVTFTLNGDFDQIKVMVWNERRVPLCKSERVI